MNAEEVVAGRRELFFGIVAPLGAEKAAVKPALTHALREVGYTLVQIKISDWLEANFSWLRPGQSLPVRNGPASLRRKELLMDAGDELRAKAGADAGVFVSILEIWRWRTQIHKEQREKSEKERSRKAPDTTSNLNAIATTTSQQSAAPGSSGNDPDAVKPLTQVAYFIDSLKHPEEIARLRRIYGPSFISIGVFQPPEEREENLVPDLQPTDDIAIVRELMRRDENSTGLKLGQHVGDAFYLTDFIVDVTMPTKHIRFQMRRLIELIFGNVHLTPYQDEYGMFLARAAQARSGSLARQIGAAVLRDDGTVAALGTNEVAKPLTGGQYWPEDDDAWKGRDKDYVMPDNKEPIDTSDWFRQEMFADALSSLHRTHALSECLDDLTDEQRMMELVTSENAPLSRAKITQNIDYVRAVHAEAGAIIDAGRHSISLKGTRLYTTTFPCHECGRHIVAAGIREVIYLEPYPKSGVRTLYQDSIAVDPARRPDPRRVTFRTFVGVAPPRYLEFFTQGKRKRKTNDGRPIKFSCEDAIPVLPYYTPAASEIGRIEFSEATPFSDFLKKHEEPNDRSTTQPA
jgi:deoxycytidylate deaminase